MKERTKKTVSFNDLIKMAEDYGVSDNALFISAARQYEIQMKVIQSIEKVLSQDDPVSTKSYIKDVSNVYAHPLVKELPKHSDSANKTLGIMIDIIIKLGKKTEPQSALSELMNE